MCIFMQVKRIHECTRQIKLHRFLLFKQGCYSYVGCLTVGVHNRVLHDLTVYHMEVSSGILFSKGTDGLLVSGSETWQRTLAYFQEIQLIIWNSTYMFFSKSTLILWLLWVKATLCSDCFFLPPQSQHYSSFPGFCYTIMTHNIRWAY